MGYVWRGQDQLGQFGLSVVEYKLPDAKELVYSRWSFLIDLQLLTLHSGKRG